MYESGEGIRRNYEEAVYWYRRAAEQESAHAMKRLGDMYRRGRKERFERGCHLVREIPR